MTFFLIEVSPLLLPNWCAPLLGWAFREITYTLGFLGMVFTFQEIQVPIFRDLGEFSSFLAYKIDITQEGILEMGSDKYCKYSDYFDKNQTYVLYSEYFTLCCGQQLKTELLYCLDYFSFEISAVCCQCGQKFGIFKEFVIYVQYSNSIISCLPQHKVKYSKYKTNV